MSENKNFKAVGGVIAAELFTLDAVRNTEQIIPGSGIRVELADYASHYEESLLSENGLVSVHHTLTLVADRQNATPWMEAEFLRRCAAEGVVAMVWLATGEVLTMGLCHKMGVEQALRLHSLTCASGTRPRQRPRSELILKCHDVRSSYRQESVIT